MMIGIYSYQQYLSFDTLKKEIHYYKPLTIHRLFQNESYPPLNAEKSMPHNLFQNISPTALPYPHDSTLNILTITYKDPKIDNGCICKIRLNNNIRQYNLSEFQNNLLHINTQQLIGQLSKSKIHHMSASQPLKNYYAILGISETASLFEIENAYEKLAAKWHPDNHKQHRKSAETKFHEIAEAYEVLSDRNKRVQYDQLLMKQYSFEDANQTFERFFNEEGIFDEDEEKFFNEHFPNPLNNAYRVLGVNKKATFEDIKAAYRKLALKYHPKANAGNQEAHNKFVEVNQAYNAICDEVRRQNYDNLIFGEMVPVRAHSIFDDFFGDRFMSVENELKPIFHNKWSKDLDSLMVNEKDENCKEGETIKTSSVWNSNNGKETGKTVTTKKVIKDGKATQETTEEYTYPTGDKKILKTIKSGDRVQSREFNLKKGQDLPKELTN